MAEIRLRMWMEPKGETARQNVFADFQSVFEARIKEADAFYESALSATLTAEERKIARTALAGLCWSEQFYHYVVSDWCVGERVVIVA